ncbi:hypothetical protein BN874_1840011 [Candidatus Contendobacter odensis Run_B_J11]|uniref:Uncharacterized protein n=1 Tax=Candidatus Contendobacter odensis Run_B_J11 TaxID=1400861 RepID=A0A7U7J257_9GAMM|nr:hypothetical protein BN874_1840011 [Candidatus Contendobacter odensis Run_B_J11]
MKVGSENSGGFWQCLVESWHPSADRACSQPFQGAQLMVDVPSDALLTTYQFKLSFCAGRTETRGD